jgi:eukaryotic-like serine/threonine-protein kinase
MSLATGTRFSVYEILGRIGEGGMGEVYRARDTRLGRDVAVKVLPESHRLDPDRLKRLDREARLLASLNHPNVATLHGVETFGDVQALVMELVEGETLDARIARAPRGLPSSEAIEIARQIAAALDAAHERGVIHRDLKPANIKIRPDGTVKVLDFGIAKALGADGGPAKLATVTQMPGAIAGTPSYMSPEQASGATVDRRTDIWAFGCVLYEMLTGQRVFEGDSSPRIIARVIERDPDWKLLPPDVPLRIRVLLRQCLEKDARRRRRDAGDLRLELETVGGEPEEESAARSGTGALWIAGAAALAASAVTAVLLVYLADGPAPVLRAEITTPSSRTPSHFAVSPDGRYLAYVASASADSIVEVLYLRDLETGDVRSLPGTGGAKYPCWSPNGRSIAYFDPEDLYRIDIDGGSPVPLAPAQNGLGCSWGSRDTILFAPNSVVPLYSVPATGGEYAEVTSLNLGSGPRDRDQEVSHRFPFFMPDGRRFLFFVAGGIDISGIHLGSLDGGPSKRLTAADSGGAFVEPDQLVFAQSGALVARRLDPRQAELTDDARTLVVFRHVIRPASSNHLAFSASTTGVFAFRDAPEPLSVLTTYDDRGTALDSEPYLNGPEISPNQRYLGYDAVVDANRDVYVRDLQRGGTLRVTTDATVEGYPVFSPDSESIIYERQRESDGVFELWRAQLNRPGSAGRLHGEASDNLIPLDWSANEYLLYRRSDRDFLSSDVFALPLRDDDATPIAVAVSPNEERMGEISPDGNWVVYDRLVRRGTWEVMVQSFPMAGDVHTVSTEAGGLAPRWSADGTKIYFVSLDGAVMEAGFSAAGTDIEIASPVELFRAQIALQPYNHQYAVTRDGRFLVNELIVDTFPPPITVVSNWRP